MNYWLQWGRARRERGKSGRRCRRNCCRSGFNGAALGGSAEREHGHIVLGRAGVASMGPRSEGARKARVAAVVGLPFCVLQWGRARRERGKVGSHRPARRTYWSFNGAALGGSAESQQCDHRPDQGIAASMGPRSEGARKATAYTAEEAIRNWLQWGRARRERGKPAHGAPVRGDRTASMGPRSEGARKDLPPGQEARPVHRASMGPRSEGARKAGCSYVFTRDQIMLQWGRARRERGKLSRVLTSARASFRLQWGRARRERGKCWWSDRRGSHSLASMGPRSEGARKDLTFVTRYIIKLLLQWGRARRERGKQPPCSCAPGAPSRFNGAALGGSAESAAYLTLTPRPLRASMGPRSEGARKVTPWHGKRRLKHASMGPRSEGARKVRRRGGGWPCASCFNGAALGGSAESHELSFGPGRGHSASMGPRSEGARKVTRHQYPAPSFGMLQWGRARRERGKIPLTGTVSCT